MIKNVLILTLIALFTISTFSKAAVAGKVVLALNCGSKEETVDSHDKVFKYQPVLVD